MRSRSLVILMYHGVTRDELPIPDWCQVDAGRFEQQIRFLATEYRVLPLADVIKYLSNGSTLPRRTACLTFDDGYLNFHTTAFPILQKYNLPSTVFLITSLIGSRNPPWNGRILDALSGADPGSLDFDGRTLELATGARGAATYRNLVGYLKTLPAGDRERKVESLLSALPRTNRPVSAASPWATLGWPEIQKLHQTGLVGFESHTHTHPSLRWCNAGEQTRELEISRDILRNGGLPTDNLFCYPFGEFTPETKRVLAELGFRCGLTTTPGLNSRSSDIYALKRVPIGAPMTFSRFELAMMGW